MLIEQGWDGPLHGEDDHCLVGEAGAPSIENNERLSSLLEKSWRSAVAAAPETSQVIEIFGAP